MTEREYIESLVKATRKPVTARELQLSRCTRRLRLVIKCIQLYRPFSDHYFYNLVFFEQDNPRQHVVVGE